MEGTQWRGLVVLGPVHGARHLVLRPAAGEEVAVRWGLPSPRVARRFPAAGNAATARFEVTLPQEVGPVELVLTGGDEPVVLARGGRDVAPTDLAAADQAVVDALSSGSAQALAGAYRRVGAVPPHERSTGGGAPWLRLAVLALVGARARPRVALDQLGRCRAILPPADFAALWEEVETLLPSLALTASGYQPSLQPVDSAVFWGELRTLLDALEALGLEVFLDSGTLLGAVRDGRPIGHDYDVDLGVVLPAADAQEAVDLLWEQKRRLAAAGLLDEAYDVPGRHHCRVRLASEVPVDLFPAWVEQGRLRVWPFADGELSATALLPLATLEAGGVALPVPADPEAVLACNYGASWREPDPTFDFDWARARERMDDFVRASSRRWQEESEG